jgi:hypothetical protein
MDSLRSRYQNGNRSARDLLDETFSCLLGKLGREMDEAETDD